MQSMPMSLVLTTASIALLGPAAIADDSTALQDRIESLEREVAELRAQTGDDWLTEERADEVRALVEDVLADADARSSLLQNQASAGWEKGFFIASPDGNFRLKVGGTLQVRFVYNHRDGDDVDGDRWGFENRRTRLRFAGHVVDPSWKYFVQGDFSFQNGTHRLLDAHITKDLGNGWSILAGKAMLPTTREAMTSHTRLFAVDRSMVSVAFSVGRAQQLRVAYEQDRVRFFGAISDGLGSLSGTTAPALAEDTEFALSGRVDVLLDGEWSSFGDLTSFRNDEPGVMVGAAVHWQDGEFGTGDGAFIDTDMDGIDDTPNDAETEVLRWTADISAEFGGATLLAAVFGNHTDINAAAVDGVDQYGALIQGGYFLTDDWELYARYQWGDDDSDADELSVVTLGFNRYFSGHQVKWTSDLSYGINEVSSTWATSSLGFFPDEPGDDGQVVLRSQIQLVF